MLEAWRSGGVMVVGSKGCQGCEGPRGYQVCRGLGGCQGCGGMKVLATPASFGFN